MSTNYPSSFDDSTSLPVESTTTSLSTNHVPNHTNSRDAIIALQTKVGVNSSAVTTTHDYKLSGVTGSDKAVSKTGTETLTNKTLTAPVINVGSDATGDMYYRNSGGTFTRLAIGSSGQVVTVAGGVPTYATPTAVSDGSYAAKGVLQGLTDASTSGLTISSGVISVNSGTGANNIVKLNGSSQIPAVDGSLLTGIEGLYSHAVSTGTQDNYYAMPLSIMNTSSTSAVGWTASTVTFTSGGIGGYFLLTPTASSNFELSTGSLPGSGSTLIYNITTNKALRVKGKIAIEDLSDRKGFGFCITPANIHTAHTDVTNGEVRFVFNGSSLYAQNANGTTATSTDISSGLTLTNWNTYEIIFTPGTSALFYVNGTLKATHTTNLPTSGAIVVAYGVNANGRRMSIVPPVLSLQS